MPDLVTPADSRHPGLDPGSIRIDGYGHRITSPRTCSGAGMTACEA